MGRVPDIVNHNQGGLVLEQAAQMGGGGLHHEGLELIVAQRLHPPAQQREDVGLLAQGGPEHRVGKANLHLGIVGQRGGERRLADAPHALDRAEDQDARLSRSFAQQAGLEVAGHLRTGHEVRG